MKKKIFKEITGQRDHTPYTWATQKKFYKLPQKAIMEELLKKVYTYITAV